MVDNESNKLNLYKRPITKIEPPLELGAEDLWLSSYLVPSFLLLMLAQQSPVKVADVVKVFMRTDFILNQIYGAIDQFQIRQIEP